MEETQSFRSTGSTDIVKIPIQHVNGQNVVYWESIEKVFPGVKCIKNGEVAVPPCIKYFPGVVLDVVVSSAHDGLQVDSSMGFPNLDPKVALTDVPAGHASASSNEDKLVEDLQVSSALEGMAIGDIGTHNSSTGPSILPPSSPSKVEATSKTALSFIEALKRASKKAKESDAQAEQQELNAKMAYMIKLQEASDAKQEEMSQLQKQVLYHQEEMKQLQRASDAKQEKMNQLQKQALDQQEEMKQLALDHYEEIKQLQIQALGQLAVLQDRVKAVLTQTYELHEYPIPRLFIVLPQDPSRWDAVDPFSNKFRLYFLCECGEHTKSIDSKTEIHIAKHEGYEIARPTEFFQLYGSHVFAILKMLKFGISVAGVAVPAISHLVRVDVVDQAASYLKLLKDIEPMMDPVIDWMDKVSANEGEAVGEFAKQMENKEALAGADLRKLDTFLKVKDGDKVLGNLYRTVTDEGHVKWVCIDHYRENYQESTAKDFQRMLDAVGGSFDKSLGRVEVTLRSKVLAEQFFSALGKARSVYELDIVFGWDCTTSDLEQLEVALKKSRVSILRLHRPQFRTGVSKILSTSSQYDVIFRIRDLPTMKVLHVAVAKEHFKFLENPQKKSTRVCKMSYELLQGSIKGKEFGILVEALKTNSTLITLDLQGNSIGDEGAKALAEALKTNRTLITLDLQGNSIGDEGAKALAETLKTNNTLTTLDLNNNKLGENGSRALAKALTINSTLISLHMWGIFSGEHEVQTLAEALKTNSTLTTLHLQGNSIKVNGAKALAEALKTNSALTTLDLEHNLIGNDGAKELAEALKNNKTLTTLHLQSNSIGSNGAQALAEALKTNKTLTTLDLEDNLIGNDGAKALAEALKTNNILTTLNLGSNSIGSNGAQALAEALKTNKTLTTLDLHSNVFGSTGAQSLSEALKTNSTLTTLNLQSLVTSSGDIRDEGAQALAEVLKTNKTLATLDLQSNSIGDEGAKVLAEALKTNKTLTTLNLEFNSIGSNGAQALAEALKTNKTLTTLNLQSNSIGPNGAQALAEALKTNSSVNIIK